MDQAKKACGKPTIKSLPCKSNTVLGLDACYQHLSIEEKMKRKEEKAKSVTDKPTKAKGEYSSAPKSKLVDMLKNKDIQIETLTNLIVRMGISPKPDQVAA